MPAVQHLVNSTNIEGFHYAVSFGLLSLPPRKNIPFSTLSYGVFILHFTTVIHIIIWYHFLPLCERQSIELFFVSIAQWHFVENETEIMQHILKMQ